VPELPTRDEALRKAVEFAEWASDAGGVNRAEYLATVAAYAAASQGVDRDRSRDRGGWPVTTQPALVRDKAPRRGDTAPLPPSTLEVNGAHLNLYAPTVADRFAWYLVMLQRAIAAGEPIRVDTVQASLGGDLVRITYPETGEQLARCAYERLLAQGAPRKALRYQGEAAP